MAASKPSENKKTKVTPSNGEGNITSVISQNTLIEGTLRSQHDMRIDGEIKGEVHCSKKVVTGDASIIEGQIETKNLTVKGKINGNLTVNGELHLTPSASVDGKVAYKIIRVEDGAQINGELKSIS